MTTENDSELISWLTTEAQAIARLLTPRVLLVATAAIAVAWLLVRAVEWGLHAFWRFGGDHNRRLHWVVPGARIGVAVVLIYTLLVSSFRAAPVLTVLVTVSSTMLLVVAFSGVLRSAYVGLGLAWRGRIRQGDRFELAGHVGIVQRFGLLRLELRDASGATLVVPNRLLDEGVIRVEAVKHTTHVCATVAWAHDALVTEAGLRKIAMLSPYRVAGSAVTIDFRAGEAEVDISVWSEQARAAAALHLRSALDRYAQKSAPRR